MAYPPGRASDRVRNQHVAVARHDSSIAPRSLDDMTRRWENVSNAEIMSLSDDTPPVSSGRSLLMIHTGGKETGGHLYRRLLPGSVVHALRREVRSTVRADSPFPSRRRLQPAQLLPARRGRRTPARQRAIQHRRRAVRGTLGFGTIRVSYLGKNFPNGKWVDDKFFPGRGGDGIRWNDVKGEAEQFRSRRPSRSSRTASLHCSHFSPDAHARGIVFVAGPILASRQCLTHSPPP